jgi:hypothetical protein
LSPFLYDPDGGLLKVQLLTFIICPLAYLSQNLQSVLAIKALSFKKVIVVVTLNGKGLVDVQLTYAALIEF